MKKFLSAICLIVFFAMFAAAQSSKLPIITETKLITASELKNLVKSPDKKPVLLNFWATWCGPCRAEFPELVEIDKDYRKKGLNFYVISVDNPTFVDSGVSEFLRQYESTMPSYLLDLTNRRDQLKAVRQIFPAFSDRYPLTLLFDKNGRLVFQKQGRIDARILRAAIGKTLIQNK